MIYTLTLNPALDYDMYLEEELKPEHLNLSKKVNFRAGGKGINVSKVLKNLGVESTAIGYVAGFVGDFIVRDLKEDNINAEFVELEGNTRINVKVNGNDKETELTGLSPEITGEKLKELTEKISHLKDGDIFQIVLSNRLEADYEGSLLESYRHLRCLNPSPYLFYFSSKDLELAGASPETLVKLEEGVLQTFPLAGTRKRGGTEEEDKRIAMELLQDEKEVSEHDMLVDLGRNDIGKIAKVGTVKVEKYHEIQRYSHVMHIGSTVMGELKEGYDALDCVSAVLPAGTLSGAPKIRAMQLIDDIEQNRRGIYGGGIGYIDFNGNLDLCIAIRFAYKKNGKVGIRSGAGIVVDSSEEKEFEECKNKAQAMVEAIRRGEEAE